MEGHKLFAERLLAPYAPTPENLLFVTYLFEMACEGHLCVSLEDPLLLKGAATLPEAFKKSYLQQKGNCWYLLRNWNVENAFIKEWQRISQIAPTLDIPLEDLENKLQGYPLLPEQKEAILKCAQNALSLVYGGPGTGKSFTISVLIDAFPKAFRSTVVAPTGKAAAGLRLKLPSHCRVQTIHSLFSEKILCDTDLLIVDESSMVDAETLATLFSLIKQGTRVVLLGDPFQLPPVENGNFFADLLLEGSTPKTELTCCLRTDLQEIIYLAAACKRGSAIPYQPLPTPEKVLNLILERLPLEKSSLEELFEAYTQFRIFSPLRHGPYGVETLNQKIAERHLTKKPLIPIMVRANNPHLGVFNGDMAILDVKEELVFFPDGRSFSSHILPKYEPAYLLSVHKSQGSEYDEIALLIPEGAERFGREILYTAITRARHKVTLYGVEGIVEALLAKSTPRFSGIGRGEQSNFRIEL